MAWWSVWWLAMSSASAEHCLVVDIGNTNATCGIFRGSRLVEHSDVPTQDLLRQAAVVRRLARDWAARRVERVLVASVVPRASRLLEQVLKRSQLPRPLLLGREIIAPVANRYRFPQQVGQDRLANAVGALDRYGAPVIIVDCGTAITIDVVDRRRCYLGGLIMPGLDVSLWALASRTALLPLLKASAPQSFIGRETAGSMLSGVVYGAAAACNGLVPRLAKRFARRPAVVVTGGSARLLRRHFEFSSRYEPFLSLFGIMKSYDHSR